MLSCVPARRRLGCFGSAARQQSSGASKNDWAPRPILVRGFAPFGATAQEKVRQNEVAGIQETIRGCCEVSLRTRLAPWPGFALNQYAVFKVAEGFDVRYIADALDPALHANELSRRSRRRRSPSLRRRACAKDSNFIDSLRTLRVDGKDSEGCSRSLAACRRFGWGQLCRVSYS